MIAVIDYGAGNLFSVMNALNSLDAPCRVTKDPAEIRDADGIILPGVGAFPDAMEKLNSENLTEILKEEAVKKPFLGICLGMQLLFCESTEFSLTRGLCLIPGRVVKIKAPGLKIPHMGWNDLTVLNPCVLTEDLPEDPYVYFVHSYRADCADEYISCYTVYGEKIPALVHRGTIYGTQFHPEKSGPVGLSILNRFVKLTENEL